MIKRIIFLMALLIVLGSVSYAAEVKKRIPLRLIKQLQGQVHLPMPCNWLQGRGLKLVGQYGIDLEEKPMTRSSWSVDTPPPGWEETQPGARTYITVIFDRTEVSQGFNQALLVYEVNERVRCEGFGSLSTSPLSR